jgi:hypothetical protein
MAGEEILGREDGAHPVEYGRSGCDGDVYQNMPVISVEKQSGLYLEDIRMVVYKELITKLSGPAFDAFVNLPDLMGCKVVDGQPTKHGGLDGVGSPD